MKVTEISSVTGGAGTLGLMAARALLEHGLSGLMIFDVNPAQARGEIDKIQAEFPAAKIRSKKVDITDDVAVKEAVVEAAEILGSVDILLCFAGGEPESSFALFSQECLCTSFDWRQDQTHQFYS